MLFSSQRNPRSSGCKDGSSKALTLKLEYLQHDYNLTFASDKVKIEKSGQFSISANIIGSIVLLPRKSTLTVIRLLKERTAFYFIYSKNKSLHWDELSFEGDDRWKNVIYPPPWVLINTLQNYNTFLISFSSITHWWSKTSKLNNRKAHCSKWARGKID